MTDTNRQLSWRQGDVLTDEAASALGLIQNEGADGTFCVVISHDCDLAAVSDKEPVVELIVACRIENPGADTFGKTARRLHIEYQTSQAPIYLELLATSKKFLSKENLYKFPPRDEMWLARREIVILQRWLAARYYRAAFPESFENHLRSAVIPGKHTFLKRIERLLAEGGQHIRGLLFDLDEGNDVERTDANDLYQLGITVLYDSTKDEPAAALSASKAAQGLEELFNAAFHTRGAQWNHVCLTYCDPVSDTAMTVAMCEMLKQWRLEHMSLQDDPPQPMIPSVK